jgi:4-amino-4-deoxy-L-arabinose transferase-like glycosyltransferase
MAVSGRDAPVRQLLGALELDRPVSRRIPRLAIEDAALVVLVAVTAVVGWRGVVTAGRGFQLDARAHLEYAQYFAHHFAPPLRSQNYEFFNPPLFAMLAIAVEGAIRILPLHGVPGPEGLWLGIWLGLCVVGALGLTSGRRRVRIAAGTAGVVAALWAVYASLALGQRDSWVSGQLVALAATLGLVVVSVLIARELFGGEPRRALAVGVVVALYPVVLRMGIFFHPESTFALFAATALLVALRRARLGWSPARGMAFGALCGLGALTRASALVVFASLLLVALLAGGRRAGRYALAATGAFLLLAGPWWIASYHLWGNPLETNLDRPGYMLPHGQPLSFYVSAPLRSLVEHPYREAFRDQLWPKLHADLWSDWFGGLTHVWAHPTRLQRVTASTQSVLGFVGDGLALAGLALAGLPALVRVTRRGGRGDPRWAFPAGLVLVSFAAFVAMLVRYPQTQGDPIKASYLLFTAPCWAAFSVAAWDRLRRRRPRLAAAVAGIGVLYVGSYAATLVAAL